MNQVSTEVKEYTSPVDGDQQITSTPLSGFNRLCWRWLKRGFPPILFILIGIFFFVIYANTFRDTRLPGWTHGPFEFDCGCYKNFGTGVWTISTPGDKITKHFFCALLYGPIHKGLTGIIKGMDSPLVCSFLVSVGIVLFGLWLYRRTGRSGIVFPILFLFGFSFTTWYVASVWESRSFIVLGSVILLVSLDRLVRKPTFTSVVLTVLSTVTVMFITIEPYLLSLVPFAILTRWKKIGALKMLL